MELNDLNIKTTQDKLLLAILMELHDLRKELNTIKTENKPTEEIKVEKKIETPKKDNKKPLKKEAKK
jgi:hypothetical protein